MAFKYADFVKETDDGSAIGTGPYQLSGAVAGYRSAVAGIGSGNTSYFAATDGTDWEEFVGTATSGTPDTLSRDLITDSSNGGAAVNWQSGERTIALVTPAAWLNGRDWVELASAGTCDIGNQSSRYVEVTGTTTITALGTPGAGFPLVWVKFAAALTLTHGASLILPGGANITTAAGDVAVMKHEGSGNWRCLPYTRADGTPVVAPAVPLFGGLLERSGATELTLTNESADVHSVPDGAGGWTHLDISTPPTIDNSGLAASTIYYCYLRDVSGTATLRLSTTVPATVSVGGRRVQVKSDAQTELLVGWARTNSSTEFVDSESSRLVRSVWNERPMTLVGAGSTSGSTSSALAEWTSGPTAAALAVPGDVISLRGGYTGLGVGGIRHAETALYVDGVLASPIARDTTTTSAYGDPQAFYDYAPAAAALATYRIGIGINSPAASLTVALAWLNGRIN